MWARNALFWSVVVVGALLVVDQLAPRGAKWDEASYRTAVRQVRRQAERLRSATDAIDAALRSMWQEAGVEPAPLADDLTVARRIALALVGTIPSLEEIRWFESLPDGLRLDMWTNRLLDDRRWADYMAERLARVFVGVDPGPFLVYRRRRFVVWLADQLYDGRPYDSIVRDLVESEGLWTDRPATNFLTVTIQPGENDHPNEAKLAGRVARAFLGMRIDCAECHDHPFDTWTQKDFHALAAFFGQVEQTLTGLRDGDRRYLFDDGGRQEPEPIEPRVPFDEELLPVAGRLRHRLAFWITHPENSAFARATVNRMWALITGRPLVEPVDALPRDGEVPPVLNVLAEDFVQNGYNLRRLIRLIVRCHAFRLESCLAPAPQTLANADSGVPSSDSETPRRSDFRPPADHESSANWQNALVGDGFRLGFPGHDGALAGLAMAQGSASRLPVVHRVTARLDGHPTAENSPGNKKTTAASRGTKRSEGAWPTAAAKKRSISERLATWAVFPVRHLLPEQLARSIIQAASLKTINHSSHIVIRTARLFDQDAFIRRYGDPGEDELRPSRDTITQRLLLMNGTLVREKVRATLFNASGLIAELAPDETKAIETAYLAVLTRRPTSGELQHFVHRLSSKKISRRQAMEDLFWALINSTEFSWNH